VAVRTSPGVKIGPSLAPAGCERAAYGMGAHCKHIAPFFAMKRSPARRARLVLRRGSDLKSTRRARHRAGADLPP